MKSIVKENRQYLQELLNSLQTGLNKAKNGSDAEDMYITEKAIKFINVLGLETKAN